MTVTCASGLSTEADVERALDEVARDAGMVGADLAVVFLSSAHRESAGKIVAGIQSRVGPRHLLGCTAQGVIGTRAEIEAGPSLALWCAAMPGAEIESFHCVAENAGGARGPGAWRFQGLPACGEGDTLLLLPDPFTTPVEPLMAQVGPGTRVIGGVASGAEAPGQNRLAHGQKIYSVGAVGARLRGLDVRPVVSQGCRPIGRRFVVTKAQDNLVVALAGRPAFEQLQEVLGDLPQEERGLARRGLQIGCALDEYKDQHGHGDFLIRSVLGVDPKSGAIAVTDRFRVGQTVQFHLRDGASARGDLESLLRRASAGDKAKGALLFSCNGRGTHMYGAADGDITALRTILGPVPLAGFFAAGEIGPVGGINHLHGFTASLALLF